MRQARELLVEYMRGLQKRGAGQIRDEMFRKRTVQQRRSQARHAALVRWHGAGHREKVPHRI